ncbi:FAD-binding oxidoreductase [Stella sp.]|uniref:FAD-binding oxidoreductase n=1 Tax=Stella sp. TaxID=2912054 RepID=UPI0035B03B3A
MKNIALRTLNGGTRSISVDDISALQSSIGGEILERGAPGYDEARSIWNAMIDKRPGVILRCRGTSDVVQAVRFARKNDLLVAVRAGGHNIAGKAVCDDGLLIDLSQMSSVRVDRAARKAWVEAGATLADFDRETQMFGLTTPVGINSTTGMAGLTLGGGFGWTTRKFGLTIDNLAAADVVTAEGQVVRTSASENPDLFWAIRGGGGNFGVVTGFEFKLHPHGPEVMSGLVVHPFADAPKVLREYRAFVAQASDELTAWVVMRKAPPLPFLPEAWHGKEVVVLAACYAGDMAAGERALAPLRKIGSPIADVIGPHSFAGWQQAFDPLLTKGARNYWKSHDFAEVSDDLLAVLIDFSGRLPGPECEIFIAHLGGAMARVAPDATAYGGRGAEFVMNVHTRWREAGDDARCIGWARDFHAATKPHALGTAYVNFLSEEEGEPLESTYGANYARLGSVKAKYDPGNMFRVNQNIRPTA